MTGEYTGPEAEARAVAIAATLGTAAETLTDTVWLLQYRTVQYGIQWPKTPGDADICERSESPGQAAEVIAAQDGISFADAMKRVEAWLIVNDGETP